MVWRGQAWVPALVAGIALAGAMTVVAQSSSPGDAQFPEQAPKSGDEIRYILTDDASKARYDGTVQGWRIAPHDALEADGVLNRNLSRSCEPTRAGADTSTQLDFTLTYFPAGVKIGSVSGPNKWVCGGEGLSVEFDYSLSTPYGAGDLWAARSIRGRRSLALSVSFDSVQAATINGRPAVFIHFADDASGLGMGGIIVIEEDTGPEFTILRIFAENGVPFAELIRIAEGVK